MTLTFDLLTFMIIIILPLKLDFCTKITYFDKIMGKTVALTFKLSVLYTILFILTLWCTFMVI